jgi:hypothetical protein
MSPSIAVCGNYWSAPCTSLYQQLYQHIVGPYAAVAASAPAPMCRRGNVTGVLQVTQVVFLAKVGAKS